MLQVYVQYSLSLYWHRISPNLFHHNSQITSIYGHIKGRGKSQNSYKLHASNSSKGTSNLGEKFGGHSTTTTCVCEHRNKGPGESSEQIVAETPQDMESGIVVYHNVTYAVTTGPAGGTRTELVRHTETPGARSRAAPNSTTLGGSWRASHDDYHHLFCSTFNSSSQHGLFMMPLPLCPLQLTLNAISSWVWPQTLHKDIEWEPPSVT